MVVEGLAISRCDAWRADARWRAELKSSDAWRKKGRQESQYVCSVVTRMGCDETEDD